MTDQVRTDVISQIAEMAAIAPSTIDPAAGLDVVGVDSLQALQLLVVLERTYKVQLSDEDLKSFTSVNSIAELVASKLVASSQSQA